MYQMPTRVSEKTVYQIQSLQMEITPEKLLHQLRTERTDQTSLLLYVNTWIKSTLVRMAVPQKDLSPLTKTWVKSLATWRKPEQLKRPLYLKEMQTLTTYPMPTRVSEKIYQIQSLRMEITPEKLLQPLGNLLHQ